MINDLDLFFNITEFGDSFTKPNEDNFIGIFQKEPVLVQEGFSTIQTTELTVICKTHEVSDLKQNDVIINNNNTYTIRNVENDGTGITTLYLYAT